MTNHCARCNHTIVSQLKHCFPCRLTIDAQDLERQARAKRAQAEKLIRRRLGLESREVDE